MLILPDLKSIAESLALASEYNLGFEYNDFYANLDDTAAIEKNVELYRNNKPLQPCTLHGAFYDIVVGSLDPQIRAVSRYRVRQSVEIGQKLGVQAVVFHTNTIPYLDLPEYSDSWLESNAQFFSQILEDNRDIHIYIENMFDFSPELLLRLSERLSGNPNYGVCLDFAHACLSPTKIEKWVETLAPYIKHIHINDCDGTSDSHFALGRGVLDIPGFFVRIAQYNLKATLLIEVRGIDNQKKSLEYLRTHGLLEK
jgi:sugar phosphate isomerase/epimerase